MSKADSAHPLEHYGVPVALAEVPPVLLRFAGACGVRDFLAGAMRRPAPEEDLVAYFTAENFDEIRHGTELFGLFVIFDPLRLRPVRPPDYPSHVFVGINAEVDLDVDLTWVPPRMVRRVRDWSPYDRAEKVAALVGPEARDDRARMRETVAAYFDEVNAIIESGQPTPKTPWYQVPPARRLQMLALAGRRPRWTPSPRRRIDEGAALEAR